jgi:hypothetical protein
VGYDNPLAVRLPATLNPTPFISWSSSESCLLTMVNEPLPFIAVSINPSSVPLEASVILPVTLAYISSPGPSCLPLN